MFYPFNHNVQQEYENCNIFYALVENSFSLTKCLVVLFYMTYYVKCKNCLLIYIYDISFNFISGQN